MICVLTTGLTLGFLRVGQNEQITSNFYRRKYMFCLVFYPAAHFETTYYYTCQGQFDNHYSEKIIGSCDFRI